MEIELGPFPRFEDIRSNAYWSNVSIDTRLRADRESMDYYVEHLKDCENHPTTGFLAKRKYITGKKKFYPEYAKRNLNIFEKQPEIIALKNSINKKINTLYPKTKAIRQYIINNDRVLLDRIEKIKKYTIKDKLILSLKRLIG